MNILTIDKLNINGEGILFCENKKIVTRDTLPQEKVIVQEKLQKKNFVDAEVIKIVQPSPLRIAPKCKYYGVCGGCDKMILSAKDCLDLKKQVIKDYFSDFYQGEIVAYKSKKDFFYRNKVSFFVKNNTIGLQKRNSNQIVAIDECIIADNLINETLTICKEYLSKIKNCQIHHIVVRTLNSKILISVVCKDKMPQKIDILIELLKQKFGENFGLFVNFNSNPKKILSEKWQHIYGIQHLEGKFEDFTYFIKPYSFLQINDSVKEIMYQKVLEKIDNEIVIEGYSGAGLLSCILARKAKKVFGIEIAKSATMDAELTKKVNKIDNLTNINGDISQILPELIKDYPDSTFVIDPPRSGCSKIVLDLLKKYKPKKIIYISCNPYTLKQNLGYLNSEYIVQSLDIYDIFPQTFEIECMVELKIR